MASMLIKLSRIFEVTTSGKTYYIVSLSSRCFNNVQNWRRFKLVQLHKIVLTNKHYRLYLGDLIDFTLLGLYIEEVPSVCVYICMYIFSRCSSKKLKRGSPNLVHVSSFRETAVVII